MGYGCVHDFIDDATRLAYVELLHDEQQGTAIGFLTGALAWFNGHGVECRQAIAARMAKWERVAGVRLYPHRCRHTHATRAVRAGISLFVLQATLGHSSSATTGPSVAANPEDSFSLRLG